jgi:hypothetical protein
MQISKQASAAGKISPARGRLAALALMFLGGIAASPAYAVPFTDRFGGMCDTSQLITNPNDANGPSICPQSFGMGSSSSEGDKRTRRRFHPEDFRDYSLPNLIRNVLLNGDLYQFEGPFGQLGMYVTPDTGFGNGFALGAGGYSARSSGVG